MKKIKSIIICLIVVILFLCVIIAGWNIFSISVEYQRSEKTYSQIKSNSDSGIHKDKSTSTKDDKLESICFDELKKTNKDTVGWLYSENTEIDYPVLQGKDNNQYLRHLPTGEYNIAGTLFVDYRCLDIANEKCYIIYGHNMHNDTMFGSLPKYKKQSYYEEHPTLQYITPDNNYTIELFAGMVVENTDVIYNIKSSDDVDSFIKRAIANSTFSSDVKFTDEDRVMVLSTCSNEFKNARFVLVGKIT